MWQTVSIYQKKQAEIGLIRGLFVEFNTPGLNNFVFNLHESV